MQRQFDFEAAAARKQFDAGRCKIGNQAARSVAVQNPKQVGQCTPATESQAARKKLRVQTTRQLRERIERIGWRCELSGAKLTADTFSLDHIVPLAYGGSHDASNIQFVHPIVNAMKGTLSMREFVGWCKLVAEHKGGESE